jgi:HAE1 family hydrophobic/amphiphilic exporter-1
MWLTKLAIDRPIFILMLVVGAIVLGFMAQRMMPVELEPDITFPGVTIITLYPGAGPEEVETQISRKIEDAVASVANLREATSTSQEGVSTVFVQFFTGTDIEVAFNDVRTEVDAMRSQLPQDALDPTMLKLESTGWPVMYIALSSPRPSASLRDLTDEIIKDRFGRIGGVGSVAIAGGDVREILVEVDADKLAAYGLPITTVWNAIGTATANVPAGRSIEGNREFSVRVMGEFASVDELRDLRIPLQNRANPMAKGPVIRLRDIADVRDSIKERTELTRLDENDSLALVIQKSADGNAVDISRAAHREIDQLKQEFPDISFTVIFDQATMVSEALTDMKTSLALAIALVVGIIFVFLHNLRGTIIVSLAIPTCIFATFMLIKALGFTINIITMLALSLAVGILVDDAIVVLENIYRHLGLGEPPPVAALNGRMEIGLAAIVITLVDVAVFIPVAMMGGIVGEFFRSFGITVACATLLSLFVSFTVTPMLAAKWYRGGESIEAKHGLFVLFDRFWQACVNAYRITLGAALRHRWLTVFIGFGVLFSIFLLIAGSFFKTYGQSFDFAFGSARVLLLLGVVLALISALRRRIEWLCAGALFGMLAVMFVGSALLGTFFGLQKGQPVFQFRFAPATDEGTVQISVIFPAGTSLAATDREIRRIEAIAMATKDVKSVFASVGTSTSGWFGSGDQGSQFADVLVVLTEKQSLGEALLGRSPEGLRTRSSSDVADDLRAKIGKIPDATLTVTAEGGWGAPIMLTLTGRDVALLDRTAIQVRDAISELDGVVDADISTKAGKPEMRAYVDRERMADADLSVASLGAVMRIFYQGDDTIKYREGGREFAIRVRLQEEDRNDLNRAANLPVGFTQGGGILSLADLTNLNLAFGPTKITRRDKMREVTVSSQLLPGYNPGSMQRVIDNKLKEKNLPPAGVDIGWEGENRIMQDEQKYMFRALGLSLILVYMLMASLFDNLIYPFIIMLAQPQALAGALLALIITNTTFDIVGFIGIILLVGLVGKNAILLVDYTNTLRRRGRSRHDAIVEAGPTRLRPITMTTLALLLAMLPIALALGRGSEYRAPLGITVFGGLTLSTLLTLLVIPCTYTIMDDLTIWFSRVVMRRKPKEQSTA